MNGIRYRALAVFAGFCLGATLTSCAVESEAPAPPESAQVVTGSVIPDGVYRHELTVEEILEAGVPFEPATHIAGVQTLTIEDETFRISVMNDMSEPDCWGSISPVEGATRFTADDAAPCGASPTDAKWIEFSWTIDGDQLVLSDLTSEGGKGTAELAVIYSSKPWTILE